MTGRVVGQAAVNNPSRLLHPGTIFVLVWVVAFLIWALVPDADFLRLTGTPRFVSPSGLLYFALALGAFLLGCFSGPVLLGATRPARAPLSWDRVDLIGVLRGGATVALAIGLLASAILLYRASEFAGGFGSLVGQLLGGVPVSYLTESYFIPARISGLTTWVHFNTAVAPLATLGWMLASRNGQRTTLFRVAIALAFGNAVLLAVTQSERLGLYEFIVAVALTYLCARSATGEGVRQSRRIVGVILLLLGLAAAAWFITEYGRTFLPRYVNTIGAPSASGVALDQLIAYVITNLNNGMYAVDHAREFTFPFHSLHGLMTTFGLDTPSTPIFGAAVNETNRLLRNIYPAGSFTTFSLPGYAFMELGWGGAVLLFWFGALVGIVHARFRAGELWAILIYPLVAVGVIDSFRILYWPQSRLLIAAGAIAIVVSRVRRPVPASRSAVRSAHAHPP
jgi:oligosaccharide repeat unit polymerase